MNPEKSAAESATMDQLVESFVGRLRAGEDVSVESYQQEYPHLATEIGQVFPSLKMLEGCRPQEEDLQPAPIGADDVAPPQLGEYRIIREIGRGGMGIVYEAEHKAMRRRVALKVLPRSMAQHSSHLARFQLEARSAGKMHHSNIVPVFEIGEGDGFHYYAMQFIRGQNLDLVIAEMRNLRLFRTSGDQGGLQEDKTQPREPASRTDSEHDSDMLSRTLAHRVCEDDTQPIETSEQDTDEPDAASKESIFRSSEWSTTGKGRSAYIRRVAAIGMQVADALAYAHHHRILHRDIKPANLLLDTDGTVWVTDFGLAKGDDDDLTRTGDIVGTLKYMPPERFEGHTDQRSDIYCLGLTLYELCTLKSAFSAPDRGQLIEQVKNSAPRGPRTIDSSIPRDFETIVLKAIDRMPSRRYQSARDLAADLHAFLMDRPIRARRISVGERLWRICRRNPVTATLSAICLGLLLTAAIGASMAAYQIRLKSEALARQNERASSHLALTEQTIDGMLKRLSHELKDLPQTSVVREQLLGEALELQQKMLQLEQGDATVALRTVSVHKRMAELHQLLGRQELAIESAQKAIDLASSLELEASDQHRFQLGRAHHQMASLLRQQSKWSEAAAEAQAAIDQLLKIELPSNQTTALADAYRELGAIQEQLGNLEPAELALKEALAILEKDEQVLHDDAERQKILAEVLNSLAILYRSMRRYEDAESHYLRCISLCQSMIDRGIQRVECMDQLGVSATNLGNLMLVQSRNEEGGNYYRLAADTFAQLESDFPRVVRYQERAARVLMSLALVQQRQDELLKAEASYKSAIAKLELLEGQHGLSLSMTDVLAASYNNLGNTLSDLERFPESLDALDKAIELRQRGANGPHARWRELNLVNRAIGNRASVLQEMEDWKAAETLFNKVYQDQLQLITDYSGQRALTTQAAWMLDHINEIKLSTDRVSEVLPAIERMLERVPDDGSVLRNVAGQLAKATKHVSEASSVDDVEQQQLKDQFASRAVGYLQAALEAGWKPRQPLEEEEVFEILWEREDFQSLLK